MERSNPSCVNFPSCAGLRNGTYSVPGSALPDGFTLDEESLSNDGDFHWSCVDGRVKYFPVDVDFDYMTAYGPWSYQVYHS